VAEKGGKLTTSESVADYAKREMAEEAERAAKKARYWAGQKRAAAELPARFWKLVDQIRSEVDTFNKIVEPGRRISLGESAGVAARAEHTHQELNVRLERKRAAAWIGITELMRLGRAPTTYIIEARVTLSRASVRIRCEAIPRGEDGIRFRVGVDGHESPFGVDELGQRLVLAIAKDDPEVLGATTGPT
jgi:hypothetical protein